MENITYREAVLKGAASLKCSGVESPEYDSRELMLKAAGFDSTQYLCRSTEKVPAECLAIFQEYIERRMNREPLQHILGEACFYGRSFLVNENVLVPRLDTEVLVEQALKVTRDNDAVLDMCTGSGCIIITMALERKLSFACGCDLSDKALEVAQSNGARLIPEDRYCIVNADEEKYDSRNLLNYGDNKDIFKFCHGDLFDSLDKSYGLNPEPHFKFDVIVSNPPYIETEVINTLSEEVRLHEPVMALDGSPDGLEFYRRISAKAPEYLNLGGYLLYEIGCNQGQQVSTIMEEAGFKDVEIIKDLAGLDRVVKARL